MAAIIEELKKAYLKAFSGLASLIEYCPEELWSKKTGGYLFAQHILHAVTCSIYYLRYKGESEELNEPVIARMDELQPGLKETAKQALTKQELRALADS